MGCASKNLTSEQDRGGIFAGGLLWKLCLYQAFTFFDAESGIRSKTRIENRKKTKGSNQKTNRLKKYKKIHIPCATLDYYLG